MKSSRGQVSIFLIFIFHILFLFFAMVINVGMLVHHKINLQNSVDLAAYYGAMKQAEILAAIAHSNYQIRQSWKLMNFRYHIIGGMGRQTHPSYPYSRDPGIVGDPNKDEMPVKPTAFCITYDQLFKTRISTSEQTVCKNSGDENIFIAGMTVPKFVGAITLHKNIGEQIQRARDFADKDFLENGVKNFNLLALFVAFFRADVKNRKLIINELASNLSMAEEEFKDLNGQPVTLGVKKTLFYNLTVENKDTTDFRFFNSMGVSDCARRDDQKYPPVWLKQITVLPQYIYYDNKINEDDPSQNTRYGGSLSELSRIPASLQDKKGTEEYKFAEDLVNFTNPAQVENYNYFDVVGVEKNPWCLAYVGVSAVATPHLPFMPTATKIKITASAYAKPFGGKIGPWYESQWGRGAPISKGGKKIDATLAMRMEDGGLAASPEAEKYINRMPNYARFPGDDAGAVSFQYQKAYGDMLYKVKTNQLRQSFDTNIWLTKTKNLSIVPYEIYNSYPYLPNNLDILAEPRGDKGQLLVGGEHMRRIEETAIAPDLFDITYYSIEPNYWDLYLKKRLSNMIMPTLQPRGDLGSTMNERFSVAEQMQLIATNPFDLDFSQKGIYATIYEASSSSKPIWGRLLTNWTEKSLLNYNLSEVAGSMFGSCNQPIPKDRQAEAPTQGECLRGGRTGYSVKLVSKKYLTRSDLKLGGLSTSGAILNPPPPNFEY